MLTVSIITITTLLFFIVSARILELGVHYFCIIQDNAVSGYLKENTFAYVLYGITMAGVFEECGRYIILKYIVKKDRSLQNALLYGIGHGGIEVWLVILPYVIYYGVQLVTSFLLFLIAF